LTGAWLPQRSNPRLTLGSFRGESAVLTPEIGGCMFEPVRVIAKDADPGVALVVNHTADASSARRLTGAASMGVVDARPIARSESLAARWAIRSLSPRDRFELVQV
jgi:hypothetical protein